MCSNTCIDMAEKDLLSSTLPLTMEKTDESQGITSCVQQLVWLNSMNFCSMCNINIVVAIEQGSMSIKRARSAVQVLIEKHDVLRTGILFDEKTKQLQQQIQPMGDAAYLFQVTHNVGCHKKVMDLIELESNSCFSEISRGIVFKCHIMKHSLEDVPYLQKNDLLVFSIHPIALDSKSIRPLFEAFKDACSFEDLHHQSMECREFTLSEYGECIDKHPLSKLNQSREFWSELMNGYYKNEYSMAPIAIAAHKKTLGNRYRSAHFTIDPILVNIQVEFASANNTSMFELSLACYLVFLYMHGLDEKNYITVTIPIDNRSSMKCKPSIGLFTNIVPFRIEIDPKETLRDFVHRIHLLYVEVKKNSHVPCQKIYKRVNNDIFWPNIPFHFEYETDISSSLFDSKIDAKLNGASLRLLGNSHWVHDSSYSATDILLVMGHDYQRGTIHYNFKYSAEKYEHEAVTLYTQSFKTFITELFSTNRKNARFLDYIDIDASVSARPNEHKEITQRSNFYWLSKAENEGKHA